MPTSISSSMGRHSDPSSFHTFHSAQKALKLALSRYRFKNVLFSLRDGVAVYALMRSWSETVVQQGLLLQTRLQEWGPKKSLAVAPQFSLEWADIDDHVSFSSPHSIQSLLLDPLLPKNTFSRRRPSRRRPYGLGIGSFTTNPSYYQGVIDCAAERSFLTPLGFRLQNESGIVGKRIRFTGHIRKVEGTVIRKWIDDVPSRDLRFMSSHLAEVSPHGEDVPALSVRDFDNRWEITLDFGDVRPRDEVWTDRALFLGSTNCGTICLEGEFRGDNLPEPIECNLKVHVDVKRRPMQIEDVTPYLEEE